MNIAFPTLPKLLSSSPGLVSLSLFDIPRSWHISSDAMVDWLSSLTRLEYLQICFLPSPSRTDRENRRLPPLTRTVFPVLSEVFLKGVTEHLDQILAHMEAPTLNYVHITFHDPPIFGISQISRFIDRTETFETFDRAYMLFRRGTYGALNITLSSRKGTTGGKVLTSSLFWKGSDWRLERLSN